MIERGPKGSDAKRNRLYSIYSKNLSFYITGSIDQFLCPVCETIITRDDLRQDPYKISSAHIIPEFMHGHRETLACKTCDNRIGSEFEIHLSEENRLIRQFRDDKGIYKKLNCGDKKYGAILGGHLFDHLGYNGKDNFDLIVKPPKKIPLDIWKKNLDEIFKVGKFSMPPKLFDKPRRNISHIYSAFLLMFSKFGYEYVLSPNVDILQQAFLGDYLSTDLHKLVLDLPKSDIPTKIPAISILIEPKEIRTFFITLPSPFPNRVRCVFLPGFGKNSIDCFNNLFDLIGTRKDYEFDLKNITLWKSPSYLIDSKFKGYGSWLWDSLIKMADHPEIKEVFSEQGFIIAWD